MESIFASLSLLSGDDFDGLRGQGCSVSSSGNISEWLGPRPAVSHLAAPSA